METIEPISIAQCAGEGFVTGDMKLLAASILAHPSSRALDRPTLKIIGGVMMGADTTQPSIEIVLALGEYILEVEA